MDKKLETILLLKYGTKWNAIREWEYGPLSEKFTIEELKVMYAWIQAGSFDQDYTTQIKFEIDLRELDDKLKRSRNS